MHGKRIVITLLALWLLIFICLARTVAGLVGGSAVDVVRWRRTRAVIVDNNTRVRSDASERVIYVGVIILTRNCIIILVSYAVIGHTAGDSENATHAVINRTHDG